MIYCKKQDENDRCTDVNATQREINEEKILKKELLYVIIQITQKPDVPEKIPKTLK